MENNQSIGKLLKQSREKKKISIEELADTTKININILRALESEDVSQLPNKTYVKGFVKNYAKTVGLNTDDALKSLEVLYGVQEPENPQSEVLETYEEKEAKVELEDIQDSLRSVITSFINKKIFLSIAAVLIIYIIGKGVFSFFMTLSQEQKSMTSQSAEVKEINKDDVIKPADSSLFDIEKSKKLQAENEENTAKVEEEKEVEKKDVVEKIEEEKEVEKEEVAEKVEEEKEVEKEEVAEKVEEEKEERILPPGKFPYKNFYPAPTNMYSILNDAPENNNTTLLPSNIKNSIVDGLENVYIRATNEDTWLSYQVDDEDIKRFVLKKGRSILIKGKTVLLFMGNVNATHIFYNNKLIDAPTKTGVKSLIFPEDAAKDFELPLFPSYKGVPYSQKVYKEKMAKKPSA